MLLELRDPGRSELAEFASCAAAWSRLPNLPYVPQGAQAASSLSGMAARKASEAAIATAQNALTAVAVPSGAYGAYESFRRNNYATGLFSVVMTALGAYSLAQGGNGETRSLGFEESFSGACQTFENVAAGTAVETDSGILWTGDAIASPAIDPLDANPRGLLSRLGAKLGIRGAATGSASGLSLRRQLASEEGVAELLGGGGKVIAGRGSRVPLRDAGRLANQYGGTAGEWAKVTSTAGGHLQTHAYRNELTGQVVELKSILPVPPGM